MEDIPLGVRMKEYEKLLLPEIPYSRPFMVRLDGCSFSKFVKGFRRPIDLLFVKCMALTLTDLLEKFPISTGYSHSDEITLVFPPLPPLEGGKIQTHTYRGRSQKIATVLAGYTSTRFNFNLDSLSKELNRPELLPKVGKAFFDARILLFPEDRPEELVNNLIWRSRFDCPRNLISTLGRYLLGHSKIFHKNSKEIVALLEQEKGLKWETVPVYLQSGIFAKKENYLGHAVNPKTGESVKCIRSKINLLTLPLRCDSAFLNFLFSKTLDGGEEVEMKKADLEADWKIIET